MSRKDVRISNKLSPVLILGVVVVVVLIVGAAYFLSLSDGGGLPEEREPVIEPVLEPVPKPVEDLPEGVTYQQGQNRISEAEFLSIENGTLYAKRGGEMLTMKFAGRVVLHKKVGPRLVTIDPAEIAPGSKVTVITALGDDGEEAINGLIVK